jgi:hypothetical protein
MCEYTSANTTHTQPYSAVTGTYRGTTLREGREGSVADATARGGRTARCVRSGTGDDQTHAAHPGLDRMRATRRQSSAVRVSPAVRPEHGRTAGKPKSDRHAAAQSPDPIWAQADDPPWGAVRGRAKWASARAGRMTRLGERERRPVEGRPRAREVKSPPRAGDPSRARLLS